MKIGIIGTGNISSIYIQNLLKFKNTELIALADLDPARAAAKKAEIPAASNLRISSVKELLAGKEIRLIVNLTIPKAHAAVALACLKAGKHTYSEKPFALTRTEGAKILALAQAKKLTVGCAPDTFLGGGIQTCRQIIDAGLIGTPLAATAFMLCRGHESWHPDPEFYYQPGGGPLFDMGPYYLTALVNLIGPITKVAGFAHASFKTRTITSEKKHGKIIRVQTPTHFASSLQFKNNALATLIMSFDVFGANLPRIEIYGSKGSLSVPDPNTFGGEIKLKIGREPWKTIDITRPYTENSRGLGVADMVHAIQHKQKPRASANLAYHVLDVMQACLETAATGKTINIKSTTAKPPIATLHPY